MCYVKTAVIITMVLMCGVGAIAQDMSVYGTPVESIPNFCYPTVQVSPDGEWIAFHESYEHSLNINDGLFIVPVEGGTPEAVYEGAESEFCFTPDSQEITFTKGTGQDKTIESVNIYTKESRVIADGGGPRWSSDGRYLSYSNLDGALTVLDTETDETRIINESAGSFRHFTVDDSAIIMAKFVDAFIENTSDRFLEMQLFRLPLDGGEPVQLTFADDAVAGVGEVHLHPDISPDGEWVLYTDQNWSTSADNVPVSKLVIFNLASGEKYDVFPEDDILQPSRGVFSADGTQIYYMLYDYSSEDVSSRQLYVADFNPEKIMNPVSVEAVQPSSFALMGNYPNPFNPSTTIRFELVHESPVKLSVYNIAGQLVDTLINETVSAGMHNVVWTPENKSAGMYFCTLEAQGKMQTHKMVLID